MNFQKNDIVKHIPSGVVGVVTNPIMWSERFWVWFPGVGSVEVEGSYLSLIQSADDVEGTQINFSENVDTSDE